MTDRRLLALFAALWSAIAIACVVRYQGWTADDFYITYRYAENLAHGRGFVYNAGERVFGLTDPGLGLLLGLLRFVTRAPVEWLASALFAAALVGIALLFLRQGAAAGRRVETAAGGSLLLLSSFLWINNGAAAPLALLLLLAAAALADRRPPVSCYLAGCLAGCAVWVRPDSGVGVALLAVLLLLATRRLPWRFAVAALAVAALGALCAASYFGTALPNTLGAKIEMAEANPDAAAGPERFWGRATTPLERHFGPYWLLVVAAGGVGLWPLAQDGGRLGRLLALHGGALAAIYPALGVPFFNWYILVPVIALLYGAAFSVGGAVRGVIRQLGGRWWSAWTGAAAGALLLLLLLGGFLNAAWAQYATFAPPERLTTYRTAAEWLRRNSRPDDSLAYVEIGVLGYYSQRRLEDLMGLVTPRVLPYVARNDVEGAFRTKPTDFVIFHSRGRMAPVVFAPWFPIAYEEVAHFKDAGFRGGKLVIYRRRPGAPIPPATPPAAPSP